MSIHELSDSWKSTLIGQDEAINRITPYLVRAQAKLNPPNKPVGVFFLMGPTGTGKTKTAESLAELLHGTEKAMLKVDCGEFQMEHEVAKMIGAPPGYLGHRETQPIFTQQKVNAIQSEKCDLSIILFDEIEKAHPGVWRAILNILDKAVLRLGDNSTVSFEKCIIFLSSNVGAKEMGNLLAPSFGFSEAHEVNFISDAQQKAIEKVGMGAMSKKFPPEFENRVDEIITYRSLTPEMLMVITDLELKKLQNHIHERLGSATFEFRYERDIVEFLTNMGTSVKYGARELKRALGRYILNPLADDFVDGKITAGSTVTCRVVVDHIEWDISEPPITTFVEVDAVEAEAAASETTTPKKGRKARTNNLG